jgi:hypothetical protein
MVSCTTRRSAMVNHGERVALTVTDEGRSREMGGLGLGLAIAARSRIVLPRAASV